jgi:hypothetical protein
VQTRRSDRRRRPLASRRWGICQLVATAIISLAMVGQSTPAAAGETEIRYFPTGSIYEYRWTLLELALLHTKDRDGTFRLTPHAEDATQNRGMSLLQSGAIDVIALGANADRETRMLPIKVDSIG